MSKLPKYPPRKTAAFFKMFKAFIEWSHRFAVETIIEYVSNTELEIYKKLVPMNTTTKKGVDNNH